MTEQNIIYLAIIFFLLVLVCSWIGDDDVAYAFLNRKPTPQESLARVRYVLTKAFASVFGGGLIALLLARFMRDVLMLNISQVTFVCFIGLCMAAFSLFLGVIQNWIRTFQGRQTRPVFDIVIWRYSGDQWSKWLKGK